MEIPSWWLDEPHERLDVCEDDLTEEREATPIEREAVAHDLVLDPEVESDEP